MDPRRSTTKQVAGVMVSPLELTESTATVLFLDISNCAEQFSAWTYGSIVLGLLICIQRNL
jgi:hypothetical protein